MLTEELEPDEAVVERQLSLELKLFPDLSLVQYAYIPKTSHLRRELIHISIFEDILNSMISRIILPSPIRLSAIF